MVILMFNKMLNILGFKYKDEYIEDIKIEKIKYGIYKIYIRNPEKYINGNNLYHPKITGKYINIVELTKNYIIVDLNTYGGVIKYNDKKHIRI